MPSENESRKDASVSLSVIHFVDREFEKERMLGTSERERLREVLTARFDSVLDAQKLAYVELQRRLDMLNHAHEEMVRDKAHFQPRELFEQFKKEHDTWRDGVNSSLNQQAGSARTWIIVMGIFFTLVQLALRYWK